MTACPRAGAPIDESVQQERSGGGGVVLSVPWIARVAFIRPETP